jgi:hypothetical protein
MKKTELFDHEDIAVRVVIGKDLILHRDIFDQDYQDHNIIVTNL